MKLYRFTKFTNKSFCDKIAEQINKDYPTSAKVGKGADKEGRGWAVYLVKSYWDYCQAYALGNCNIRGYE